MSKENDEALIAQIGRTIGLWGDLKFNLHTDFPEQFMIGNVYKSTRGDLTIADINEKRGTIRFIGYESIDAAKKLTNVKLFSDENQTRKNCDLKEGQHFWFDILGCSIQEQKNILGKISDIQRMGDTDYLIIDTEASLIEEGFAKTFLVPYIKRFVVSVNLEEKMIYTQGSKDILEAS